MVTGLPNPIIQDGYINVPETPGLGIDLNEEVIREHLTQRKPTTSHRPQNGIPNVRTIGCGVKFACKGGSPYPPPQTRRSVRQIVENLGVTLMPNIRIYHVFRFAHIVVSLPSASIAANSSTWNSKFSMKSFAMSFVLSSFPAI